jgi:hypothetical protein
MRKILYYIIAFIIIPLSWLGAFLFWLCDKAIKFFDDAVELSCKITRKYK